MLQIWAPDGAPEITDGDDLAAILLGLTDLDDGDIVVVTSKVVSKAEGRVVEGERDDWIAKETRRIVARRGATAIVRTNHGLTLAAAGVDSSNVEAGKAVLLPDDPDASARRIRSAIRAQSGRNVAVIVSDTAGRAWRVGQTDIAIGAAGLVVSVDHAGIVDNYGNELAVTLPAVADEVAGAADLVRGKLAARPFAVIRGRQNLVLDAGDDGPGAATLVRGDGDDMFGYGSREAVLQAAIANPNAQAPFGIRVPRAELEDALARVPDAGDEMRAAIVFAFGWTSADRSADLGEL